MAKFIEERQIRISNIKKALHSVGKIDKDKFIAQTAISLGCTVNKIEEYIKLLSTAGYVKIEDGMIIWIE